MQREENPFDRDPQSIPLIRFVLHSTSLSDEIMSQDSPAQRLIRLNSYEGIEVIPLPTTDDDLRRRFADNGLVSSEYRSHEVSVELRLSNGSVHNVISPFTKCLPKNFWEPIIDNSTVTLADLFASDIGDFLVVATTEPSLKRKVARNGIITAEQALEIVRVILTAHNRFYVGTSRMLISKSFYYLYRFKKLFKWYQYAWTIAAYAHDKGLSEKVYDYLLSLGTRLEFICRAYDKVAFFSMKTANYSHQSTQLYHLVYFIMLITGVFDDLAHIIKEFYHMPITGRMDISLRLPKTKKNQKPSMFYQLLQSQNNALHDFLIKSDIQRDIKAFYPLRDSLQHRELPMGVELHEMSEPGKNVFELSRETAKELKEKYDTPVFIIRGDPCFLDPLLFIKWAQEVTIRLVNGVLSSIEWDSFCATLPKDIQDKIHESHERYKQGLSQLLGWPEDPLYF